ncbi:MAG: tetratricopeptide repeat protein [Planctomycetota bacterium]|jgi:tetratricopeptide (TPR) repeat protein
MPRQSGSRSRQRRPEPEPAAEPAAAPRPAWDIWRWWAAVLLVPLATFAAYGPALNAEFVNWDDDHNVYRNPHVTDVRGLGRIWFSTENYQYYPLVFTSFWIECHVLGARKTEYRNLYDPQTGRVVDVQRRTTTDARLFHRTNVLLHAVNALLVWFILRRLKVAGAYLAALVFALHPVHVESVAWVTERKNLLMGAFALGCVLAQLRFERLKAARSYALALFLYVLALLSKAVASMLAPALLILRWMRRESLQRGYLLRVLPYFVLGGIFGVISSWFERTRQFERLPLELDLTIPERIVLAGRVFWFYVTSLLWPANLMLVNPRWDIDPQRVLPFLWPLSVVAVWALLFGYRKRLGRGPVAAVSLFMVLLLPASGLFDVYWMVFSWVADHFQYLASIALIALGCAAVSHAAQRIARRAAGRFTTAVRTAGIVLAICVLSALGALTYRGSQRFTDSWALWRHAAEANPDAWIAHNFMGGLLVDEGRYAEAIACYDRALELFPRHPHAHHDLGVAYAQLGEPDLALEHYLRAFEITPLDPRLHNSYAHLMAGLGRHEEAVEYFRQALAMQPDWAQVHESIAGSLAALGRFAEAADELERAAALVEASNPGRAAGLREQAGRYRSGAP